MIHKEAWYKAASLEKEYARALRDFLDGRLSEKEFDAFLNRSRRSVKSVIFDMGNLISTERYTPDFLNYFLELLDRVSFKMSYSEIESLELPWKMTLEELGRTQHEHDRAKFAAILRAVGVDDWVSEDLANEFVNGVLIHHLGDIDYWSAGSPEEIKRSAESLEAASQLDLHELRRVQETDPEGIMSQFYDLDVIAVWADLAEHWDEFPSGHVWKQLHEQGDNPIQESINWD